MEYNANTPHQRGTKAFKSLTFKEQALSINGQCADLEKAIRAHARRAAEEHRDVSVILEKCVRQVERLTARLRA